MIKHYCTNYLKSVTFYLSILLPIFMFFATIWLLRDFKNNWFLFPIFYPFLFILEFLAIKYRKVEITIDDNGIQIKRWREINKVKWDEIKRFEVSLFNWGWELSYQLITTDKKMLGFITEGKNILGFGDSIENCDDLIKEIENHTGLKLKKTV